MIFFSFSVLQAVLANGIGYAAHNAFHDNIRGSVVIIIFFFIRKATSGTRYVITAFDFGPEPSVSLHNTPMIDVQLKKKFLQKSARRLEFSSFSILKCLKETNSGSNSFSRSNIFASKVLCKC